MQNSIADLEEHVRALDGSNFAMVMQKLDRVRAQNATLNTELHKQYDRLIDETYMLLEADHGLVRTEKQVKDWQARRVLLLAQLHQLQLRKPPRASDS